MKESLRVFGSQISCMQLRMVQLFSAAWNDSSLSQYLFTLSEFNALGFGSPNVKDASKRLTVNYNSLHVKN